MDPTKFIKTLTSGQIPAGSARPGRLYRSKSGEEIVVYYLASAPIKCGHQPPSGGVPYKRLGPVCWYGWLPPDYPLTEVKLEEGEET
jgi:hypothetical protein